MSKNKYTEALKAHKNTVAAIEQQSQTEEEKKKQREQQAIAELESMNRGVYNSYLNAINPYGRTMEQFDPEGSGVSDYFLNSAYGEYLKGLGQAQINYDSDIKESNSLWQEYLAQKAGLIAQADNDYAELYAEMKAEDADLAFEKKKWEADQAEKERERLEKAAKEAAKASGGSGGKKYTEAEMNSYYVYTHPLTGQKGIVKGKKAADGLKDKGYIIKRATKGAYEYI